MILTKGCILQVKKEQNYNKLPLHTTNYHCNFPRRWKGKREMGRIKKRTDAETVDKSDFWNHSSVTTMLHGGTGRRSRQHLIRIKQDNLSKSGSVSSQDLLACQVRFKGQMYDNTWHNASDCNNFFVDVKLSTKKKEEKKGTHTHLQQ